MDHQEWFERFKANVRFDDNSAYPEVWVEEGDFSSELLAKAEEIVQSVLLKMVISILPSSEKQIVKLIFFDELSEREVAKKLNLPKTKVHRLKARALKSLSKSPFAKAAFSPETLRQK